MHYKVLYDFKLWLIVLLRYLKNNKKQKKQKQTNKKHILYRSQWRHQTEWQPKLACLWKYIIRHVQLAINTFLNNTRDSKLGKGEYKKAELEKVYHLLVHGICNMTWSSAVDLDNLHIKLSLWRTHRVINQCVWPSRFLLAAYPCSLWAKVGRYF